jgi:selT/selW/selH-like putative selenoprotein
LAAEIKAAFPDARVEMIPSGGGRFEVKCDGRPVFEKSNLGRHAMPGEVVRVLRSSAP